MWEPGVTANVLSEGGKIVGFRTKVEKNPDTNPDCDTKGITKTEFICRNYGKTYQTGRLVSTPPPR